MTCSMLASVKDFHILLGKMAPSVSMKLALVALSHTAPSSSASVGNRPALLKMFAKRRPMTQAIAVVTRK